MLKYIKDIKEDRKGLSPNKDKIIYNYIIYQQKETKKKLTLQPPFKYHETKTTYTSAHHFQLHKNLENYIQANTTFMHTHPHTSTHTPHTYPTHSPNTITPTFTPTFTPTNTPHKYTRPRKPKISTTQKEKECILHYSEEKNSFSCFLNI